MSAVDPEKRRRANADYYDRIKADPVKFAARRTREREWRKKNKLLVREQDGRRYERERTHMLFLSRLDRLLMRVVRAHGDPEGY